MNRNEQTRIRVIRHDSSDDADRKPLDEIRKTNIQQGKVDFSIIRFLRLCIGMNQGEFSRQLGISQVYCHELENGKAKHPSEQIVERISQLCGIKGSTVRFFLEEQSGRSQDYKEQMINTLQKIADGASR